MKIRRESEAAKFFYEIQKKKNADDENQQRKEKNAYTTSIYQESHAETDHDEKKKERALNATFIQWKFEIARKFRKDQNAYEKRFDVDKWHNFVDDSDEKNIRRINAWCTSEQREHIQSENDDWKNRQTK